MDRVDAHPEYVKLFKDAIEGYGKAKYQDGALVNSIILIVEFIDANGKYHLEALSDGKTPPWKLNGMIAAGQEIVLNEELDDEE
jgi:hypothetical protein